LGIRLQGSKKECRFKIQVPRTQYGSGESASNNHQKLGCISTVQFLGCHPIYCTMLLPIYLLRLSSCRSTGWFPWVLTPSFVANFRKG